MALDAAGSVRNFATVRFCLLRTSVMGRVCELTMALNSRSLVSTRVSLLKGALSLS